MCSNKNAAERTIPKRTRSPLIRLFSSAKNCKNSQKCVHLFALLCFALLGIGFGLALLGFACLCLALLLYRSRVHSRSWIHVFMGSWIHGSALLCLALLGFAWLCLAWLCLALLGFALLCFAWLGFVWLGLAWLCLALLLSRSRVHSRSWVLGFMGSLVHGFAWLGFAWLGFA